MSLAPRASPPASLRCAPLQIFGHDFIEWARPILLGRGGGFAVAEAYLAFFVLYTSGYVQRFLFAPSARKELPLAGCVGEPTMIIATGMRFVANARHCYFPFSRQGRIISSARGTPSFFASFSSRFRSTGLRLTVIRSDCFSLGFFGGLPVRSLSASISACVRSRVRLPIHSNYFPAAHKSRAKLPDLVLHALSFLGRFL